MYCMLKVMQELSMTFKYYFRCDNPSMTDIRAILSASRFAVKKIIAKNKLYFFLLNFFSLEKNVY